MEDESNTSNAGALMLVNEDSKMTRAPASKPRSSKSAPKPKNKIVLLNSSKKRKADQSDTLSNIHQSKKRTSGQLQVNRLNAKKSMKDKLGSIALPRQQKNLEGPGSVILAPKPQSEASLKVDQSALGTAEKILKGKFESIGKDDDGHGLYKIKGLETPMRDYQIIASAFMIRHERSQKGPQGGIIADEMGIGKTLEAMGCMMLHKPSKQDRKEHEHLTLIVTPSRHLCAQWYDEFKKHTDEDSESIEIYQGGLKARVRSMWGFDYILTTYKQVFHDYNKAPKGVLFQLNFNRIILDEGHGIKNRCAKTSKACRALKGNRKWILSGTPFHNAEKEALPYLQFIGVDMKLRRSDFESYFGPIEQDDEHNRIMKVLELHMLRRGLEHEEMKELKGMLLKTSHQSPIDGDSEAAQEKANQDENDNFSDIIQYLDQELSSKDNTGCTQCQKTSKFIVLVCGHRICYDCYEDLVEEDMKDGKRVFKCPECNERIKNINYHPDDYDDDDSSSDDTKPTKDDKDEADDSKYERGWFIKGKKRPKINIMAFRHYSKPSGPGDDVNGQQPKANRSVTRWLKKSDTATGKIQSSSKVEKTLNLISDWQDESPDDKIIVYLNWTVTAKVLGRMLGSKKIPFLYYWGNISCEARQEALRRFREDKSIKVLLASLTAGSSGLNIECANRVISLDPWWNVCVEEQAFGRVWRHGQQKATYIVRIIARDTIDERMLQLQETKAIQCNEAIKQGKKPKPLSNEETLYLLFGNQGEPSNDGEEDSSDDVKDESDDSDYEA
ncbi:P-loop containing nucleoside triphosphate hydrolase protein [Camillea tinctor]|nr:P-loop containing nucleoside triphosphate hydrolase protein [Camillea tinctor]